MWKNFPTKKYNIIYVDPPWKYQGRGFNSKTYEDHGAADQYPVASLEDLKTLPISSIMAPDSLLYCWTTGPKFDITIDVIRHWNTEYKTVAFVWKKGNRKNAGFYTMSQCEYCIVSKNKNGKIPQPRGARNVEQFLNEPITVHSKKPIKIRNRIQTMHPTQKAIELFARWPGDSYWDVWGNQTA